MESSASKREEEKWEQKKESIFLSVFLSFCYYFPASLPLCPLQANGPQQGINKSTVYSHSFQTLLLFFPIRILIYNQDLIVKVKICLSLCRFIFLSAIYPTNFNLATYIPNDKWKQGWSAK